MLDLWKEGAFSVSVPGKQELVDLCGGRSTNPVISPRIRNIFEKDIRFVVARELQLDNKVDIA